MISGADLIGEYRVEKSDFNLVNDEPVYFQIQLGQQVFLAGAHEALDCHHRRVHDTQLAVARQEGAAAQQEGHGARHIGAAGPAPYLVPRRESSLFSSV